MSAIKVLRIEQKHGKAMSEILSCMVAEGLPVAEIARRTSLSAGTVTLAIEELGRGGGTVKGSDASEKIKAQAVIIERQRAQLADLTERLKSLAADYRGLQATIASVRRVVKA